MVRASQAFGLPALASIAASGSGGRGSDDDDHWGTGGSGAGDSDDDEDSEDDEQNEWALGFGSDDQESGSEYQNSDEEEEGRASQFRSGGPQLGEAGPSNYEDVEVVDETGMDEREGREFTRLVDSIKTGSGLSGGVALTRDWDQTVHDALDDEAANELDRELLDATGPKRKRGTGRGRGPRREPELSPEIQALLGRGNLEYVGRDYVSAINTYQEVIMREPAVAIAWTSLATCHRELKNDEKALQCEMMAAHLRPNAELWRDLGSQSRAAGAMQQAIYCYQKAIRVAPHDVDAMWDHAYLLRETGDHAKAIQSFKNILALSPHDVAVLTEMAGSFVDAGQIPLGQQLLLDALHYQESTYPNPAVDAPESLVLFSTSLLVILADLLMATERNKDTIVEIKRAVRWLGGRSGERKWDRASDDREFDREGTLREGGIWIAQGYELDINLRHRLGLCRLYLDDLDEARTHFSVIAELNPGTYQVLWSEIAEALLVKNLFEDALPFFAVLSELTSDPKHVEGRGDCLRAAEDFESALEAYLFVNSNYEDEDPAGFPIKLKLANVYEMLGRRQEALDFVTTVIDGRRIQEANAPPKKRGGYRPRRTKEQKAADAAAAAAAGFADVDDGDEDGEGGTYNPDEYGDDARDEEGQPIGRKSRKSGGGRGGKAVNAQVERRRRVKLTRQEMEANRVKQVTEAFALLEGINEEVEAGDEAAIAQWLDIAGELVDGFRQTKILFPSEKNRVYAGVMYRQRGRAKNLTVQAEADQMEQRLQRDIEGETIAAEESHAESTTLRTIPLETWYQMVVKYCCLLARYGPDPELAAEVAEHCLDASPFRSTHMQDGLRLTYFACTIATGNPGHIVETARRFIQLRQFSNLALHVLVGSLGSGVNAAEALANYNLQKSYHRDMRAWLRVVQGDNVRWGQVARRWIVESLVQVKRTGATPAAGGGGGGAKKKKAGRPKKLAQGSGDDDDVEELELDQDIEAEIDEEDRAERDELAGECDGGGEDESGFLKPKLPTVESPIVYTYYAAMLMMAKSYQGSIFYLTRAYTLNPVDPLICLLLAISYTGRAFQRQADNKNYDIVQGLAFLDRYRRLHPDGPDVDEVEYNFGSLFHRIGVLHRAVDHYKRILARAEKLGDSSWQDDPKSLVREAAYSLTLIYSTTGSSPSAREVTKRWLTI